jgi:hypothetical protein
MECRSKAAKIRKTEQMTTCEKLGKQSQSCSGVSAMISAKEKCR